MCYLVQYAVRRSASIGRRRQVARVDERLMLNRPDFDGGAYVRVFVEDTSNRKLRRLRPLPEPRLKLRIADCVNTVYLEFALGSPELRENARFKIDTLIASLERFRAGLAAESALRAEREASACRSVARAL